MIEDYSGHRSMAQCLGTTQRHTQCRNTALEGARYCHVHQYQAKGAGRRDRKPGGPTRQAAELKPRAGPASGPSRGAGSEISSEPSSGYIYIYTFEHLLAPKKQQKDWLQIKKLGGQDWELFDGSRDIFIKVGFTTRRVETRISEWELKCGHKFCAVGPGSFKVSGLGNKVRHLVSRPKFQNFSEAAGGFVVAQNVFQAEQQIHQLLRQRYGRGDMLCAGCRGGPSGPGFPGGGLGRAPGGGTGFLGGFLGGSPGRAPGGGPAAPRGPYGTNTVHSEWFKVRRADMFAVFRLIDNLIAAQQGFPAQGTC